MSRPTKEARRAQLEEKTAEELVAILRKHNPFGGYTKREAERHREGTIESVLRWEGYPA
jgi:hypothetical protein